MAYSSDEKLNISFLKRWSVHLAGLLVIFLLFNLLVSIGNKIFKFAASDESTRSYNPTEYNKLVNHLIEDEKIWLLKNQLGRDDQYRIAYFQCKHCDKKNISILHEILEAQNRKQIKILATELTDSHFKKRLQAYYKPFNKEKIKKAVRQYLKNKENSSEWNENFQRLILKKDINDFNNGTTGLFKISDGELKAIEPKSHSIPKPTRVINRWKGDLLFRPEKNSFIELNDHRIVLIPPSGNEVPKCLPLSLKNLPRTANCIIFKNIVKIDYGKCLDTEKQNSFYIINQSEDHVLKRKKSKNETKDIEYLGNTCTVFNIDRKMEFTLVKKNQNKEIINIKYYPNGKGEKINIIQNQNGREKRVQLNDSFPMNKNIATVIDELIKTGIISQDDLTIEKISGTEHPNINLTLDPLLQEKLQKELSHYALNTKIISERPFKGSIAVMDIKSGDLLALASFPDPATMDTYKNTLKWRQNHKLELYENNQNFEPHFIGSITKPLLAATILNKIPDLVTLRIGDYGKLSSAEKIPKDKKNKFYPSKDFLGFRLSKGITDSSFHFYNVSKRGECDRGRFPIGFLEFLKYSSNRYMFNLFFLAVAHQLQGNHLSLVTTNRPLECGIVKLKNETIEYQPQFSPFFDTSYKNPIVNWNQLKWLDASIRENFTIFPSKDRRDGEKDAKLSNTQKQNLKIKMLKMETDYSHWFSLIKEGLWSNYVLRQFKGISYPKVHWKLHSNHHNRLNDLRDILLGAGENKWSNIALAEMFATLVTGKKINSNLIFSSNENHDDNSFDEFKLQPAIREKILQGLSLVIMPDGRHRFGNHGGGTANLLFNEFFKTNFPMQNVNRAISNFGNLEYRKLIRRQLNMMSRATYKFYGKTGTFNIKSRKRGKTPPSGGAFIFAIVKLKNQKKSVSKPINKLNASILEKATEVYDKTRQLAKDLLKKAEDLVKENNSIYKQGNSKLKMSYNNIDRGVVVAIHLDYLGDSSKSVRLANCIWTHIMEVVETKPMKRQTQLPQYCNKKNL